MGLLVMPSGCSCQQQDLIGDPIDIEVDSDHDTTLPDLDEEPDGLPDLVEVMDSFEEEPEACIDADGDGFGDESCGGDDCDDSDPSINPGAEEICGDGIDQDCDGSADELTTIWQSDRFEDTEGGTYVHVAGMAWTGSEFIVVWTNRGSITYLDRRDAMGEPALHTAIAATGEQPAMAWTGSSIGLSWATASWAVQYMMVDTDGAILAGPLDLAIGDEVFEDKVAMTWTGSEMAIVWMNKHLNPDGSSDRELVLTRIDPGGTRTASDSVIPDSLRPSTNEPPSVAWSGSRIGIAWQSSMGEPLWDWSGHEILFVWQDPSSGIMGDVVNVSNHEGRSKFPHIGSHDGVFSIVWADEFTVESHSILAVVDGAGISIVDASVLSGESDPSHSPSPLSQVWTGSEYVVAAQEFLFPVYEISLSRADAGGTPLGDALRVDSIEWNSHLGAMVWTGSEIGIVMNDGMYENKGLYLVRLAYCE